MVLFDALLVQDVLYITDSTAETLAVEYVVKPDGMIAGVVSDEVLVVLLETGVANADTIGYGKLQNSLAFHIMGTEVVPTVGITAHNGRSTDVTYSVNNWDVYLCGWDYGNSMLQFDIKTFLEGFGIVPLRGEYRKEGENCLAND